MNEVGKDFEIFSPNGTISTSRLLEMFVDDTCQFCNTSAKGSVLQKRAHNLKHHSKSIFFYWWIISFIQMCFLPYPISIWSLINNIQQLPVATDHGNAEVSLGQLDPNDPWKTLGCFICPTGNQKEIIKQLLHYATHWEKSVNQSTLSPDEVKYSYHTVLLPQITHRLAASYLTPKQCETIMQVISNPITHAQGFLKNIAKIIIHSPPQYAGMVIHHIYDLQGHEKIKFMMVHTRKYDHTRKILIMCIQWSQMWSGLESFFWNEDYDKYSHLVPNSWVKNLWRYTDSRAISIDITKNILFPS